MHIRAILSIEDSQRAYYVLKKLVELDFIQPVNVKVENAKGESKKYVTKYTKKITRMAKELRRMSRLAGTKFIEEKKDMILDV